MTPVDSRTRALEDAVGAIADPEIPVLTISDLGVLRSVDQDDDGGVVVTITPTYSGCPAMNHIESEIAAVLDRLDIRGTIRTVFAPAWTTDWISEAGRQKLETYGIAPPHRTAEATVDVRRAVRCPQCRSTDTAVISEFGSTACKALYQCRSCHEPFDYFKEH